MAEPDVIYSVALDLLECARAEVAQTIGGLPSKFRVCVVPGEVAWDDCECPGLLAVSVTRIYPSTNFPAPDTTLLRCHGTLTAVEYTVTILRCAPQAKTDGTAPTCEQLDAAARIAYADLYAVWRGVLCCLASWNEIMDGVASQSEMQGPAGLCVGSVLTVIVGLQDGCMCDEGEFMESGTLTEELTG